MLGQIYQSEQNGIEKDEHNYYGVQSNGWGCVGAKSDMLWVISQKVLDPGTDTAVYQPE